MRFIVVAALLLAGCGQPQQAATYTPEYELNFMRACQANGTPVSACGCVWGKISTEVPVGEFEAYELLPAEARTSHPLTAQVREFIQACAPPQAPEPVPVAPEGTQP